MAVQGPSGCHTAYLLCVEGAVLPRDALAYDLGVLVDKHRRLRPLSGEASGLLLQ
jgi:hypothetical protein